jgi:hypothetical protein
MTSPIRAALLAPLAAMLPALAQLSPVAWEPQPSGVTVRLRGVSAVSPTVAWVSGGGRSLLAVGPRGSDWSADGQTWAPAGGDGYDALSLAPGGDVGWATGAGGRIARVTALATGSPTTIQVKAGTMRYMARGGNETLEMVGGSPRTLFFQLK